MTSPVIVGELGDPHVKLVVKYAPTALVIDAQSLSTMTYGVVDGTMSFPYDGRVEVAGSSGKGVRGWIRRVAPQDWFIDVESESKLAAIQLAWLTLLTAFVRESGIEWLTDLERISAAENKLVMAATVARAGIPTPTTVVTNSTQLLASSFEGEVVVKPLGPGHYFANGTAYNVFAESAEVGALTEGALSEAPFLVQQRLHPRAHFRVVTIRDDAFVCRLDARGLPADWRRVSQAHQSFVFVDDRHELRDLAVRAARALRLGFSSQDWIEDAAGYHLLDANPGGQWAFLPDPVPDLVGRSIAGWLGAE